MDDDAAPQQDTAGGPGPGHRQVVDRERDGGAELPGAEGAPSWVPAAPADQREPVVAPAPDRRDPPLAEPPAGVGPGDPEERLYSGVEVEDEDGRKWVPRQQAVGKDAVMGGGEFPDPATPPTASARGSVADDAD